MKYLKLFDAYNDPIDDGHSHNTYHIDGDYVLKMPKDKSKQGLEDFNTHIKTMQEYPELFPNVKKLDKYRASVEWVDVEKAKQEYRMVWHYIYNVVPSRLDEGGTMEFLVKNSKYLKMLKIEPRNKDEYIILKWYKFLKKLQTSALFLYYHYLDLHPGNFGIDKKGNIKLIDF